MFNASLLPVAEDCARLPQVLPHCASVFGMLPTTSVAESFSICLQHRSSTTDIVHLMVHVLRNLLDKLDHERRPPCIFTHIQGVVEGPQQTFFFSSQRQLICFFPYHRFSVNLGFTTFTGFLLSFQVANPDSSWLSILMNFGSSSIILNLLLSWRRRPPEPLILRNLEPTGTI